MKKIYGYYLGIAAISLLVFLGYFPTLSRYRDLKFQEDEIERKIQALDRKIQELREEKNLLQNDVQYLEKVIRGELGLVKPGEIVYKFVEEGPSRDIPQAKSDSSAETVSGLPPDSKDSVKSPPVTGSSES